MLLTLSTTSFPATDLGYLLHKHPAKVQSFELSFGVARVFYPEVNDQKCSAALLLEIDPIDLVRGKRGAGGRTLDQYVNDRPYAASSFLSVALADVFRSAMNGTCKDRPEAATRSLALEAKIAVLPCRGGEVFLRRLFEPLGYTVEVVCHPLDETQPDWGPSRYFTVTLKAEKRLSELLSHLYVLIPVLDDDKHYWVGDDEVEKLLRFGEGWLSTHPERAQIATRYLKHRKSLASEALSTLIESEPEPEPAIEPEPEPETATETESAPPTAVKPPSLQRQRLDAVAAALKATSATRVLDLGCGEGALLRTLRKDRQFQEIVGIDVSHRVLEVASERLKLRQQNERERKRITLRLSSLTYRDKKLAGYDAAAVVEVIEHLDPPRLAAFERVLFEFARPKTVLVTTPNSEFNVKYENLAEGALRHHDHRFEWTRQEFQAWAERVASSHGYTVAFSGIGSEDPAVGTPTQMAVFSQ